MITLLVVNVKNRLKNVAPELLIVVLRGGGAHAYVLITGGTSIEYICVLEGLGVKIGLKSAYILNAAVML